VVDDRVCADRAKNEWTTSGIKWFTGTTRHEADELQVTPKSIVPVSMMINELPEQGWPRSECAQGRRAWLGGQGSRWEVNVGGSGALGLGPGGSRQGLLEVKNPLDPPVPEGALRGAADLDDVQRDVEVGVAEVARRRAWVAWVDCTWCTWRERRF
jgi:hypothetical protein